MSRRWPFFIAAPERPEHRGERRYSIGRRVLGSMVVGSAMLVVAASLAAYLNYRADWNGITRINVQRDLRTEGTKRPPLDPNAINLLLIGSDTRAGRNRQFGATVAGQRSDTIMVVHIAPDAHQVVVVSMPRDTVVPILKCAPEDGSPGQTAQPGSVEQINATFAYGGPGCLWETIEQTTGIHLNDFIELTFTGFEHVINDLGGVNVCLPVPIRDTDSKLHLTAGRHHIGGREALAFWRVRYIGDGSDLQRIQRDQFLMASVLQGIEHSGLLTSPAKMYRVITDITRNHLVATDTDLTPGRLLSIGEDLHGLSTGAVHFIEAPTAPYPGDPQAWVEFAQPEAKRLFTAIAHDTRLPGTRHRARIRSGSPPVLASVNPAGVRVQVLNGTTTPHLATNTSDRLAGLGYTVVSPPADAANSDYVASVIEYPSAAALPAARTLEHLVSHSRLVLNAGVPAGTVQLILGSTFSGLRSGSSTSTQSPAATHSAARTGTGNLTKQFGGISGNISICSDSSVFQGPDGQ